MFLNDWTDIQNVFHDPDFSHPSGGPTSRMLPSYKAMGPAIDWISLDIYKHNSVPFVEEATPFSRPDNRLMIPETGHDLGICRRMFYALGNLKGIGVSVFSVEAPRAGRADWIVFNGVTDLAATYCIIAGALPLLAPAKKDGALRSAVEEEDAGTLAVNFGENEATAQFIPLSYGYGERAPRARERHRAVC